MRRLADMKTETEADIKRIKQLVKEAQEMLDAPIERAYKLILQLKDMCKDPKKQEEVVAIIEAEALNDLNPPLLQITTALREASDLISSNRYLLHDPYKDIAQRISEDLSLYETLKSDTIIAHMADPIPKRVESLAESLPRLEHIMESVQFAAKLLSKAFPPRPHYRWRGDPPPGKDDKPLSAEEVKQRQKEKELAMGKAEELFREVDPKNIPRKEFPAEDLDDIPGLFWITRKKHGEWLATPERLPRNLPMWYTCEHCGQTIEKYTDEEAPTPQEGGTCPMGENGEHKWERDKSYIAPGKPFTPEPTKVQPPPPVQYTCKYCDQTIEKDVAQDAPTMYEGGACSGSKSGTHGWVSKKESELNPKLLDTTDDSDAL